MARTLKHRQHKNTTKRLCLFILTPELCRNYTIYNYHCSILTAIKLKFFDLLLSVLKPFSRLKLKSKCEQKITVSTGIHCRLIDYFHHQHRYCSSLLNCVYSCRAWHVDRTEIDACLHIVKLWLKARIAAHRSVRVQLSQACVSCVLMELRLICLDCSQGMLAKTLTDTKQFLQLYATRMSLNPNSYFKSETKMQLLKRQKCLTSPRMSSFWKCAHTRTHTLRWPVHSVFPGASGF